MFYHPSLRYNTSTMPTNCAFYLLRKRKYKDMFCTECQFNKSVDMRKRKRVTQTPTRTRPFNNLSPDEKLHAYEYRNKKFKSIARKHNRLVIQLSKKENQISLKEGTPALDLLRKYVNTYPVI